MMGSFTLGVIVGIAVGVTAVMLVLLRVLCHLVRVAAAAHEAKAVVEADEARETRPVVMTPTWPSSSKGFQ